MEKIGEYLRYSREQAKKSPYDVERDIQINHTSIYRWEQDKNLPTILQCVKLADYYGISLDDLVGREFGHTPESKPQAVQINNGNGNTQNNYFK